MADSPAHKFGQNIGFFLEALVERELNAFCNTRDLYLDKQGPRGTRKGKKLSWIDKYGNSHDLDFVIEKGGSFNQEGRPIAFIEAAWRRYTKHSRNKSQEIQGAVLPISEKHYKDKPFLGVVLAGIFTEGSRKQLESSGFKVLYFPYSTITSAFKKLGLHAEFEENTPLEDFARANKFIDTLTESGKEEFIKDLAESNKARLDDFLNELQKTLDRNVERLIIVPLHGDEITFESVSGAIKFIDNYQETNKESSFKSYRIIIEFSNGDKINGDFNSKERAIKFCQYTTN